MPTATPTLPVTECSDCGAPTMRLFTNLHRPVLLDAELVPCGMFVVDDRHRAVRQPLTALYAQRTGAAAPVLGYEPHQCDRTAGYWWAKD